MGFICGASRFETRNVNLDDYNTMSAAFIGGDGRAVDKDLCPVDKLFFNYAVDVSNLGNNESKEVYEIYRMNRQLEIEDNSEELARQKLKLIIHYLESMKSYFEKESRRTKDFKKVLIGQKYATQDVIQQLNVILVQLTSCVEESPTAAQVLDLDNESGLKSETIKGDSLAWKKMPLYLIRLSLENPFLFDYVKYEVQRAEIDYSAS